MMRLGRMAAAKGLRSLSGLRGTAGVGVAPRVALFEWREFSAARRALRARRPPPQAGEVKRAGGRADSTKNHHALGGSRESLVRGTPPNRRQRKSGFFWHPTWH